MVLSWSSKFQTTPHLPLKDVKVGRFIVPSLVPPIPQIDCERRFVDLRL